VDGTRVSDIAALDYRSSNGVLFVTWGSPSKGGAGNCASGAVHAGGFKGSLGTMRVLTRELSEAEIAELAHAGRER